jgi:hypothetical protein
MVINVQYIFLHVKYLLFLLDVNETRVFPPIFEKSSNIKLRENSSSVSRVVPCGQTDGETC